jgi:hypothetical protein
MRSGGASSQACLRIAHTAEGGLACQLLLVVAERQRFSLEVRFRMGLLLLIFLLVLLLGGLPTWGYSRNWGYGPSGVLGVLLVVLLIMLILNVIPPVGFRFGPVP